VGRGSGGVPPATDSLGNPAHVELVHPGPENQIDVGWAHEHDDSHRDLEGLHPPMHHVGGLLVVAVHLHECKGHGHAVDRDLLGGLDDLVEQLQLLGLQGLEHPPPHPRQ